MITLERTDGGFGSWSKFSVWSYSYFGLNHFHQFALNRAAKSWARCQARLRLRLNIRNEWSGLNGSTYEFSYRFTERHHV